MPVHIVEPQRPDHPDHAAPDEGPTTDTTAAVAQYSAVMLPGVLYVLGVYVFDGAVPAPLHGVVGLVVTGLCTLLVRYSRRRG